VVWGCAAVVLGVVWLASILGFIAARRRKWRAVSWVMAVPVALMPLVGLGLVGLIGFAMIRGSIPRYVYEDTFRQPPSADVRNIKSKNWGFADSAHVFMRFETSPDTFRRIVPEEMQKVTFAEYQRRMPGSNVSAPEWWAPPTERTSEIFLRVPEWGSGRRFASESELLTYDPSTQTVMYSFLGID
jgi:hypothetical protein